MHVVFCTPTLRRPFPAYLDALERSAPALEAVGIKTDAVFELGNVYISGARAILLGKAMKTAADVFVFLDHDLSWRPEDMLRLLQHPGDVVAGDYRFKQDKEEYMGRLATDGEGRPIVREDGTLVANAVPAGFLKVTRAAVERFATAYPELRFGHPDMDHVDLFNHGASHGLWWGEDYAFCRRWRDIGGEIHLIPDLEVDHWLGDRCFPGNLHNYLLRQPGGILAARELESIDA